VDGELERRVARLQKGDHLCLIFDSAAEQAAALISFLKAGLGARERCLWMAGAASSRRLERALNTAGVDVERELDRGGLVLLSERRDWLLSSHFDPGQMLDLLRRAEQQALDDGFSGLRVAWDMAWLLEDDPAAGRLVELEAHLNQFLKGSRTTILCQYSRGRSSPELMHDILRTHPLALLGERLCPNGYYEPPALVLGDLTPDERVDWMIAKLLQARANERKLEEVTRRLAQNGAALKRADRAKEELLAMLAHELRNPLGTVSNALQVLRLKGAADETDETWRRAIDAAERQVHHQALLIDDLLEASRVTRGEIELNCERLDLAQVTRETVEGYRETLRNAGLALEVEVPPVPVPVHGDRLRLSQALSNLLHNATKFTAPGGKITVRLCRGNHRAEISVCDTGVGISPEVLPHVFEVFTQADHSLDRAQGGLGMGLAVVRGLIEMHGGEVEAYSPGAGKGAELRLRLPLLEEDLEEGLTGHMGTHGETTAGAPHAAQAEEPHADSARRILVVEDNPDHAATMRDFLELSGHQVELASSGTDGVAAAREFHPEVVLCDLGLPGMTGYEVAAELRRDPSTASAQLIAVTGYGGEDDRRRSREAGFDLHLTKPVDPGQLKRVLQTPGVPAATPPAPATPDPAHTGNSA
jgi:signal transduction histidine kinase/ActR/RegA family two-component response regulator